jgi:hypothetical protein
VACTPVSNTLAVASTTATPVLVVPDTPVTSVFDLPTTAGLVVNAVACMPASSTMVLKLKFTVPTRAVA